MNLLLMHARERKRLVLPWALVIGAFMAGCAASSQRPATPVEQPAVGSSLSTEGAVVQYGDEVMANCTCWFANQDVAFTTEESVGRDEAVPKSPIYHSKEKYQAVKLLAVPLGDAISFRNLGIHQGFEVDLALRLGEAVIGQGVGEEKRVTLTAEVPAGLPDNERYVEFPRVRQTQKEHRIPREYYFRHTGMHPAVGQAYRAFDPLAPGKVVEITEEEVLIQFAPITDGYRDTSFGRETIEDMGDHFQITVDVEEGRMVRNGPMVGRIIKVDEETFTVDYGSAFAGEPIACEVTVESIGKNTFKTAGTKGKAAR